MADEHGALPDSLIELICDYGQLIAGREAPADARTRLMLAILEYGDSRAQSSVEAPAAAEVPKIVHRIGLLVRAIAGENPTVMKRWLSEHSQLVARLAMPASLAEGERAELERLRALVNSPETRDPVAWISQTECEALKDGKAAFVTPGGGDGDTPLFGA
jgi:hypothetical protein